MKRTLTEQQKKTLSVLAIVIFVLLSAALAWFVGRPMVRFAKQPEQFRAWVDGHGAWGPLAYVAMVFLQVLVAIIPGEPLEIAGGYAFGAWQGTALCLAGAVLGSVAVFALVRRWGRGLVAVFCGAVNCPIASVILSVELFGAEGMLYFAMACAISYVLSGYCGLYSSQTILYSKLKAEFINVHTHE